MSDETYQIETRRRSRSKTPFLRSSCDRENCEHAGEEGHVHHKKKKSAVAPNVQTIVEEHVVESHTTSTTTKSSTVNSSSSNSNNKTTRSKALTQITSDYSSDDATPEAKKRITSTMTTMLSNTGRRLGNALSNLSAVTSTPRSQLETTQNALNTTHELLQKQQQQRSNGNSQANISDEHLAYIEYKNAGEYWNKTPKTDYTYSELSPHRRQLAPGIVAMPNMSRRSLEHHDERVNYMVNRNPTQEQFIRERYQANYAHVNYDSGDEVDITQFGQQTKQSWWLIRFISIIVSSVRNTWTRVTSISQTETSAYQNHYAKQRRQQQQNGVIVSSFLSLMRYVYLGIASVLSLDTWLLKSNNTENKSKKRFLLALLLLLPLLLLTGLFYYLHPNESFPPKSLNRIIFTLPELPKIDVGAYLDAIQYDSLRTQTVEQAMRVRDWADDYLVYLKTIGQNVASKGRQLFQSNNNDVYYERI